MKRRNEVQQILCTFVQLQTGFLGTAIILPILTQIGAADVAYRLLLQRGDPSWLYSVDQGATTIWERWNSFTLEKGFGPVSMNSFNHYAYGAAAEWMAGYMAGIMYDFERPGFAHIIFRPYPNRAIHSVGCEFDSPQGTIASNWAYTETGFVYEITVPAGTTGTVYWPLAEGSPSVRGEGAAYIGTQGDRAVYEAGAGAFRFAAIP